jgi:hypothetical protein
VGEIRFSKMLVSRFALICKQTVSNKNGSQTEICGKGASGERKEDKPEGEEDIS